MVKFLFDLGAEATLLSGEKGTVTGRAEYSESEPSYYLRYVAADGRLTEGWWSGKAFRIEAHEG